MLGLKESVCDLAEQSWALEGEFECSKDQDTTLSLNAVLGLKESLCDLAEQSWALGGEFSQECSAGTEVDGTGTCG